MESSKFMSITIIVKMYLIKNLGNKILSNNEFEIMISINIYFLFILKMMFIEYEIIIWYL